jgi:excisionase family DNA binding protein
MSRNAGHSPGTVPLQGRDGASHSRGAPDSESCRLLDVHEAARYLNVSPWTIRDMVGAGSLRRVRLPLGSGRDLRRLLVDKRDLDELVARSK